MRVDKRPIAKCPRCRKWVRVIHPNKTQASIIVEVEPTTHIVPHVTASKSAVLGIIPSSEKTVWGELSEKKVKGSVFCHRPHYPYCEESW